MPALVSILFGSLFTLASAYSIGRAALRGIPAPRSLALATGAAVLSLVVLLLFLAGAGNVYVFTAVGGAAIAAGFLRGRRETERAGAKEEALFGGVDRVTAVLTGTVFAAYAVLYVVHALTPETQPDAAAYHLGLVAEWIRLGRFADRVGFYEVLPQGAEMLFAFAFAFGRHSAAKLVHFGLLAATVPLIMATGRRLRLPPWVPAAAAVFYACAPVVGVAGTSAYTDAALVLGVVAAFYSLLAWDEERRPEWLAAAGLCAGFCYSVKMPALVVAALAVLWVLARSREWKPAAVAGAWALLMIAPWMLRAAVISGNPVAPLMNQLFPNPYFHVQTEELISQTMRSYGGVALAQAPLEWTIRGLRLQGLIGPLFLLTPLGLLALRRREGRLLWAAAALLVSLWFLNIGTRFLMPSLPFLALALALAVPRPVAWALIVLHAVSCWPQAIDLWNREQYVWRLRGFPWAAALRVEPEEVYLSAVSPDYRVARMLDENVPPGERVFGLVGHAMAYRTTEAVSYWHSAESDRVFSALMFALNSAAPGAAPRLAELSVTWPEREVTAVRLEQEASGPQSWSVHEIRFLRGVDQVRPSWALAKPNTWEAAYAFDRSLTSRWTSWTPMREGMAVEAQFYEPAILTGAAAILDRDETGSRPRFYGRGKDRRWERLGDSPVVRSLNPGDLRWEAMRVFKRAGFKWILVAEGEGRRLDQSMLDDSAGWGLKVHSQVGNVYLLRAE